MCFNASAVLAVVRPAYILILKKLLSCNRYSHYININHAINDFAISSYVCSLQICNLGGTKRDLS